MMGTSPAKPDDNPVVESTHDPFDVYVPLESLTEPTVRSIISVATRQPNWDFSERTLLIFLLAINKKLNEIETNIDDNESQIVEHAKNVRKWLVNDKNEPLDWERLQTLYDQSALFKSQDLARYYGSDDTSPYFELKMKTPFLDVKNSRKYMKKYRENGYKPEELSVYWNAKQLEDLCPKDDEQSEIYPPHDPSDKNCIENLRKFPVSKRNHDVKIEYINNGIEKAVFDIPADVQIIVLNFANEQSPGGGYLRHALAQEEVILYNSDGYRALLDLKYGRMGNGYAIPEFGLAYVRNMRFFKSEDKYRETDMLVSACYCLNGEELYPNPGSDKKWRENNLAKFYAFMAAAVANTKGDGSDTYLLLGPIGTGAFGNDVQMIAEVFREVLDMPMMNSTRPIRYAFGHIQFVSTDDWKNETFKDVLSTLKNDQNQEN